MSLTLAHAPLARQPAETNYAIDGPAHRILFEPFPRRLRAELAGEVVLDTRRAHLLHETGLLPQVYVPLEDVRADLLEPSDHGTHCPFKGDATYRSVRVGDRVSENALWLYEDPIEGAEMAAGLRRRATSTASTAGSTRTRSRSAATSATRTTASTSAPRAGR